MKSSIERGDILIPKKGGNTYCNYLDTCKEYGELEYVTGGESLELYFTKIGHVSSDILKQRKPWKNFYFNVLGEPKW